MDLISRLYNEIDTINMNIQKMREDKELAIKKKRKTEVKEMRGAINALEAVVSRLELIAEGLPSEDEG